MKGVTLRRYPDDSFPRNIDFFDVKDLPIPSNLKENDLLIRVCYISVDPVMRVWFSGAKTYIDTVLVG
jgi:NADPH-dependent curcumin reductase CurA